MSTLGNLTGPPRPYRDAGLSLPPCWRSRSTVDRAEGPALALEESDFGPQEHSILSVTNTNVLADITFRCSTGITVR